MRIGNVKEVKYYPDLFWRSFEAHPYGWCQYEILYTIYYKNGKSNKVKYVAMWYANHFKIMNHDYIGHLEISRRVINTSTKYEKEFYKYLYDKETNKKSDIG